MSTQSRIARLAALAVILGGGLLTVSTTAATATPVPAAPTGGVHKAPQSPFIVDGVRYQPQQISKFDGRALYFVVDLAKPHEMVGFTDKRDFDTAVAASKALGSGASVQQAGQYATLYANDELTGDSMSLNSPYGINYLAGVNRGCGLFGCAGNWDNVASSIYINGRVSIYDDIEYRGSWLYLAGTGWGNLSWWGFDNITSSMNVWW
jgi:hypothetical protein